MSTDHHVDEERLEFSGQKEYSIKDVGNSGNSVANEKQIDMTESMQSLVDGLLAWGGQDDLSFPTSRMSMSIDSEKNGLF